MRTRPLPPPPPPLIGRPARSLATLSLHFGPQRLLAAQTNTDSTTCTRSSWLAGWLAELGQLKQAKTDRQTGGRAGWRANQLSLSLLLSISLACSSSLYALRSVLALLSQLTPLLPPRPLSSLCSSLPRRRRLGRRAGQLDVFERSSRGRLRDNSSRQCCL